MLCKNCLVCGKQFHTKPSYVRKGRGRFCSPQCSGVYFKGKTNPRKPPSLDKYRARFESKITKTLEGCWNWTGAPNTKGYGQFWYGRQTMCSHFSWFLRYGVWTPRFLLHRCDNALCVNPDHLFEGTQQDNMTDKKEKGRCAVGSKHGAAKLNEHEVKMIKASPDSYKTLGERFGVSLSMIGNIKSGRNWTHITEDLRG